PEAGTRTRLPPPIRPPRKRPAARDRTATGKGRDVDPFPGTARRSPPATTPAWSLGFAQGPPAVQSVARSIPSAGEPRVPRTKGVCSDADGEAGDSSLGPDRLPGALRRAGRVPPLGAGRHAPGTRPAGIDG